VVSDAVKVRKPFMLLGAVGAIVMSVIFLTRATQPHTGYYSFVLIISLLAVFMGIAYAPWMASFTETVEQRNPALTATGLAVWGWIVRAVVAISIFVLPFVISSVTPLVQYGTQVATLSAKYAPELQTIAAIDPKTLATLNATPADQAAAVTAIGEIAQKLGVDPATATQRLQAVATVPKADLAFLQAHGPKVEQASRSTPGQWQTWWWVCIGGQVVFIPLIFVMSGRWSRRRALRDLADHQEKVDAELAALAAKT
jgi:hypothetical protein